MPRSDDLNPSPTLPGPASILIKSLLGLLVLLALISTGAGAKNAIDRSQDFQWSGEKLLLHHVDPWAEYLRGDPGHHFLATQVPNYLPILYVMIVPVGLLPLLPAKALWLLCNLVFAVTSGILAARFYGLRGFRWTLAVVCLLLIATPTRTSMGNGQQGILILFLWCLSLLGPTLTDTRSAIAGLSYLKFNFAPAAFLYLFFRGGLRSILFTALPSAVATLLVWLWLTGGHVPREIVRLIGEPFAVSRIGYFPSGIDANLMDVLETALVRFHTPERIVNPVTFATALLLCAVVLYTAMRRRVSSAQWQIALMTTMSFCLFKHHTYDGVVLLLPLCYALRLMHHIRARIVLFLIVFIWYIQRIIDFLAPNIPYLYIFHWVVLMAVLALIWSLRPIEEQVEPAWQSELSHSTI